MNIDNNIPQWKSMRTQECYAGTKTELMSCLEKEWFTLRDILKDMPFVNNDIFLNKVLFYIEDQPVNFHTAESEDQESEDLYCCVKLGFSISDGYGGDNLRCARNCEIASCTQDGVFTGWFVNITTIYASGDWEWRYLTKTILTDNTTIIPVGVNAEIAANIFLAIYLIKNLLKIDKNSTIELKEKF